ncbi:MAG TPA: CHRD domain-containing protein [Chryseosolibacter sp.]
MKTLLRTFVAGGFLLSGLLFLSGCNDNDPGPQLTGERMTFDLSPVSDPAVSGTVTFARRDDEQVLVTIQLSGTQPGASYPAHIHAHTAAAGGGIVLDLTPVDGSTGKSETVVGSLNDGTTVGYQDLLDFDGYLNVHLSETDLATLIAQGDIGQNELTDEQKVYTLTPVVDPAVSGTATFIKRANGKALVVVALTGAQPGTYSSHIHANTIAQGGGIVLNLNSVDGTTGMAKTSVDTLNNGTPISYDELLAFNGYLNVHSGSSFLGQADIGGNELTGDTKVYTLTPVIDPNVSGTATFAKRKKGTTLVTVSMTNTQAGTYSSHIHANTIADGGSIVINLKSVDGTTGKARTSVDTLNNGEPITYEQLLNFNGYLNVHSGSSFLGQADIGQNELTGDNKVYTLNEVASSGVSGTATFAKRKSGKTLITLSLTGTTAGGDHPAHIHANNVQSGGGVVLTLKNVKGETGKSATSANALNDATAITYDQLLVYNGYINVHLSAADLATLIAQGNIGSNAP